jgi:putative Ca2+/H+ antiporter (TMEM165/GDT1 family)
MGDLMRAFLTVFPAELPDKSMVATIVLVARFGRPLAVWVGATLAFGVHVAVAVAAGSAIGLLPEVVVGIGVTGLFAVGAAVLFRTARSTEAAARSAVLDEAERVAHLADERSPDERSAPARSSEGGDTLRAGRVGWAAASPRRAIAGSFGVIVLAEWGDLTQLATASLAARSDAPLLIGVGAFLALASVAGIAATLGRHAVARVPIHRINYVSAAIFASLAAWSLVEVVSR